MTGFLYPLLEMNFQKNEKIAHGVKKCVHLGRKICVYEQVTCVIQLYI